MTRKLGERGCFALPDANIENDYHFNIVSLRFLMVSQLSRFQSKNSEKPFQSDPQALLRIRHTCAHVLAMAVQTLFPETKVTIKPWTDTGFYYDFDRKEPFTPDDLSKIEAEMRRIIQANLPIVREEVDREQIRTEIEQLNEISWKF